MIRSTSPSLGIFWLLVSAFVLRVAMFVWQLFEPVAPSADHFLYLELAAALKTSAPLDERLLFVSPLYPYIVAALNSFIAIQVMQLASGLLSLFLIVQIAKQLKLAHTTALLAGWLFLLYPSFILLELRLYPTTLSLLTLLISFFLFLKWQAEGQTFHFLIIGSMMALTVLLNQSLLLFIPIALIAVKDLRSKAVPLLLPLVLGLSLITLRNYTIDGTFLPLGANSGVTMAHGNLNNTSGGYESLLPSDASKEYQHQQARRLAEAELVRPLTWKEIDSAMKRQTLQHIANHPLMFLNLLTKKWVRFFADDFAAMDLLVRPARQQLPLLYLLPCGFTLLLVAAFLALIDSRKAMLAWHRWTVALLLTSLFTSLLFFVAERYRVPLAAFLTIPAAVGLRSTLRLQGSRKLVLLSLFLGTALLFVARPATTHERFTWQFNRAQAMERWGQFDRALNIFAELHSQHNLPASAHALARIHIERQDWSEGEQILEAALRTHPDHAVLLNDLAVLNMRSGKWQKAEMHLRHAAQHLDRYPQTAPSLYLNQGLTAEHQEEYAASEAAYRRHLKLKPHSAKGYYLLARLQLRSKQLTAANLTLIDRGILLAGGDSKRLSQLYNLKGLTLEGLNRRGEAREFYEKACRVDSTHYEAAYNLYLWHRWAGNGDKAEQWQRRAALIKSLKIRDKYSK